jgi:hypothetical protein
LKINFGFNQGRFHQSFQNISPHKKNVSIYVWCLNATFSNISAISRQPVLVVEEAGVPKRTTDHGEATGKLYHLRLRIQCTLSCNLQSPARTHAVLVSC